MNSTLNHSGTPQPYINSPRGSGRYRKGTGENPFQHELTFRGEVKELRKKGMSDKEIAEGLGMTTTELRQRISIEKEAEEAANIAMVKRLSDKGYSNVAIGERMGVNESVVRSWKKKAEQEKLNSIAKTADILESNVKSKKYIDVGPGVEREIGVSRDKLQTAITALKDKGYVLHHVQVDQLGVDGNKTTISVLCPPGTEWKEVAQNMQDIRTITDYTTDNGKTYFSIEKPKSLSSDRIQVRYAEDGGKEKDGVIELRRGVEDISLGNSNYAQVRIAVDGTHYLKGMAIYSDNMPKGVDVIFNTNKHDTGNKLDAMKELKYNSENPFGANIKPNGQRHYIDADGKEQLGVINIVNEEGDWDKWKKNLASQMLSKQDATLIKSQLNLDYERKKNELEAINTVTNPSVKIRLLNSFADDCDSAAVHLQAAALPRQASHVILPVTSLKDNEIYAPNYRNGENVVLIRYPHGGIFEIPQLKVNNNNKEAKSIIPKDSPDAVGINSHVANILSGADFDGDTVLVIPVNDKVKIKTSPPLEGLKDFDPKEAYPAYPGMQKIKPQTKQNEMGRISNLITDMTLQGADKDEIARAVRHSMVVIDAEKHNLNYKQSYIDNGIADLKKKYQGGKDKGASTLISRASADIRVPQRQIVNQKVSKSNTNPETGERIFKETGRTYIDKQGRLKYRTSTSNQMTEAFVQGKDAYSLSSGTYKESLYADYANKMKAMANEARKTSIFTEPIKYSQSANKTYSEEVKSLESKLNLALKNAPRERQAQIFANYQVKLVKKDNPDLTNEDLRKIKSQKLEVARARVGSAPRRERNIQITPKEWEAIQAGAISKTKLDQIIDNSDLDQLKQLATPRSTTKMTSAKIARAKSLSNKGYTLAQIADILGVSTSTVSNAINA